MPNYLITIVANGEEENPIELEASNIEKLLNKLLDDWVAGDIDLRGVMLFLRSNGVNPPKEDEEVLEGENEPEITAAADSVREIIGLSSVKQAEFIEAIREGGVLISLLS